VLTGGTMDCWGDNTYDQLGIGPMTGAYRPTPVAVNDIHDGTAPAAGGDYICSLLHTGAVDCWGQNNYGQLGNGTIINASTPGAVIGL
jgi:alpha-tubulin suppressor-like RCC1 family protein